MTLPPFFVRTLPDPLFGVRVHVLQNMTANAAHPPSGLGSGWAGGDCVRKGTN